MQGGALKQPGSYPDDPSDSTRSEDINANAKQYQGAISDGTAENSNSRNRMRSRGRNRGYTDTKIYTKSNPSNDYHDWDFSRNQENYQKSSKHHQRPKSAQSPTNNYPQRTRSQSQPQPVSTSQSINATSKSDLLGKGDGEGSTSSTDAPSSRSRSRAQSRIVHVWGLPWSSTEDDVAKFFADLSIEEQQREEQSSAGSTETPPSSTKAVWIERRSDGKSTGHGYVKFIDAAEV